MDKLDELEKYWLLASQLLKLDGFKVTDLESRRGVILKSTFASSKCCAKIVGQLLFRLKMGRCWICAEKSLYFTVVLR